MFLNEAGCLCHRLMWGGNDVWVLLDACGEIKYHCDVPGNATVPTSNWTVNPHGIAGTAPAPTILPVGPAQNQQKQADAMKKAATVFQYDEAYDKMEEDKGAEAKKKLGKNKSGKKGSKQGKKGKEEVSTEEKPSTIIKFFLLVMALVAATYGATTLTRPRSGESEEEPAPMDGTLVSLLQAVAVGACVACLAQWAAPARRPAPVVQSP